MNFGGTLRGRYLVVVPPSWLVALTPGPLFIYEDTDKNPVSVACPPEKCNQPATDTATRLHGGKFPPVPALPLESSPTSKNQRNTRAAGQGIRYCRRTVPTPHGPEPELNIEFRPVALRTCTEVRVDTETYSVFFFSLCAKRSRKRIQTSRRNGAGRSKSSPRQRLRLTLTKNSADTLASQYTKEVPIRTQSFCWPGSSTPSTLAVSPALGAFSLLTSPCAAAPADFSGDEESSPRR